MLPVEHFLVSQSATLEEVLDVMGRPSSEVHGSGFALVTGEDGMLAGVITDADFRRFVRNSWKLPVTADEIAQKHFFSFDLAEPQEVWETKLIEEIRLRGWRTETPLRLVPVLSEGVPIGVEEISPSRYPKVKSLVRVVVVGLGYVGLTVAGVIAGHGYETIGIEQDPRKLGLLEAGADYLREPGLTELLSNHSGKNLTFLPSLHGLCDTPNGRKTLYLICVGTPIGVHRSANLGDLFNVIGDVKSRIRQGDSVVLRSTVPVGTTRQIANEIEAATNLVVGKDFFVASAPERTVEGNAIREISELPQLVGGVSENCTDQISSFFNQVSETVVVMQNSEAAELAKLASNAFRDYHFAFANYLSRVAREKQLDINKLIHNVNVGYSRNSIPKPSPGVGGPCLSKDSWILDETLREETSILASARIENSRTPAYVSAFLMERLRFHDVRKVFAIGIAFKGVPETNDLRDSPGVEIAQILSNAGFELCAWDAVASVPDSLSFDEENFAPIDAILLLNNHRDNPDKLRSMVTSGMLNELKVVFDPWELLSGEDFFDGSNRRISPEMVFLSHVEP
jgi:nucleotide sugar dehydrogenase